MSEDRNGTDRRTHHAERAFLSIGEVLALLQDEFPDVTISKIRFLESQGLIDPERTPSGYRKFYDGDVDRLRFILREQRTNFLPLKVIKDRLDSGEPLPEGAAPGDGLDAPAPVAAVSAPSGPSPDGAVGTAGDTGRVPIWMVKPPETASSDERSSTSHTAYTFEELAAAARLHIDVLREIERFGLLSGQTVGTETLYDEHSLAAASAAAGFMRLGLEPRHLRLYRNAADREAGLIEQVIMPLVKQRNPQARVQAVASMEELSRLGALLRDAMLRQNLRPYW